MDFVVSDEWDEDMDRALSAPSEGSPRYEKWVHNSIAPQPSSIATIRDCY